MSEEKKVRKVIRRGGDTVVLKSSLAGSSIEPQAEEIKGGKIKVIPLSGMSKEGSCLFVVEFEEEIIVVDGGFNYIKNETFESLASKVDLSYLLKNRNKVKAILLTHGHEDQLETIIQIVKQINIPVIYGPPFAVKLLSDKFVLSQISKKIPMTVIKPRQIFRVGSTVITYFRNNHSLPDSYSILLHTPVGKIIYTGDFKFDFTPQDKEFFDFYTLAKAGEDGVLLLISESSNAKQEKFTPSETSLVPNLEKLFRKTEGKIIVSTFSSHLFRIFQVVETAMKLNKKIIAIDDIIFKLLKISKEMGYVNYPDSMVCDFHEITRIKEKDQLILTTAYQFDEDSPLSRMAYDEHMYVTIKEEDTVIISAMPSQRNEQSFLEIINAIKLKRATVYYGSDEKIYVSGHAGAVEKRMLINMVKPQFFLPCRGDLGYLLRHGKIAQECGVKKENIFIMKDGDVLELGNKSGKIRSNVLQKSSGISTPIVLEDDIDTQKARQKLHDNGLVSLLVTIKNGVLVGDPVIDFPGVSLKESRDSILSHTKNIVTNKLKKNTDVNILSSEIESDLASLFKDSLDREPLIQVMVLRS